MSAKRFTFEGCGFADQLFKHDGKETTRVEHGDRFVSEADYEAVVKRVAELERRSRYLEWMLGPTSGVSSSTILWAFDESLQGIARHPIKAAPNDSGDMQRCVNLLRQFPEIAAAFPGLQLVGDWEPWRDKILAELERGLTTT